MLNLPDFLRQARNTASGSWWKMSLRKIRQLIREDFEPTRVHVVEWPSSAVRWKYKKIYWFLQKCNSIDLPTNNSEKSSESREKD